MTTTNPRRFRGQFIALVVSQVLVTALISLQWSIIMAHYLVNICELRSIEQQLMDQFTIVLSAYLCYLKQCQILLHLLRHFASLSREIQIRIDERMDSIPLPISPKIFH